MAAILSALSSLKRQFAIDNLERLARYDPPVKPPPVAGLDDSPCNLGEKLLEHWSNDQMKSIQASIKRQAFGGKQDIDWNVAFLPFMESCAVYLRDYPSLLRAWKIYRDFKKGITPDPGAFDTAILSYQNAYKPLEDLAKVWGMGFLQVCDLVHQSPDGHTEWDGPYCGAFYTTDSQKDTPLIGIAFKGTNPLNFREVLVDYNYDLQAAGKYLGDQQVSVGVYTGLFGAFDKGSTSPYAGIVDVVSALAKKVPNTSGIPIRTHVTGHSLGGSYSTFCYAQQLIDAASGVQSKLLAIGDEYTFGAPRVGSELWSELHSKLVDLCVGQSWRVVNNTDIVPQVPATTIKPTQLDFYHIDKGMHIFDDKVPVPIPTEQGGPAPAPFAIASLEDLIHAVLDTEQHRKCIQLISRLPY